MLLIAQIQKKKCNKNRFCSWLKISNLIVGIIVVNWTQKVSLETWKKLMMFTWNPDSWKFIIASEILMLIGSIVISTLKGPASLSDRLISDSEENIINIKN